MSLPPPRRLSEHDAWDIAMTWQPQLQGRVHLVVDCDGPVDSIIKSYAWVHMSVPRALSVSEPPSDEATRHREQVSVMRAVMISWAALAACPGYSAAQNPSFWKRVISALHGSLEDPSLPSPTTPGMRGMPIPVRLPPMVVDAYGFFNRPGHTFPRFAVDVPGPKDDTFSELFTPDGPDLTLTVCDILTSIMARLGREATPFVPEPSIDIRLSMHAKYPFTTEDSVALSTLVAAVNGPSDGSIRRPFRICQLEITGRLQFAGPEHIDGFLELARAVPLPIPHFYFSPLLNKVARDDRAKWLYAFLRLDGHGVHAAVTAFSFARFHASDAVFQSLLSALPFATSVQSLNFDTERDEDNGTFESTDLPWIAYAIFHPRAASSSWRHLNLSKLTLTEETSRVLSAMARGNNLLQLLNGKAPDSDAYYSARLLGGTVVEAKRRRVVLSLDLPSRGDVVLTVPPASMTVDVCGISSLDPATWSKWVAVIVPAYGLGWVRASDLHDVQAHAPATHSLSGLHLCPKVSWGDGAKEEPPEAVLHLLRPLGHMISYLDVRAYTNMSAPTLHEILRACPSLRSLSVSHNGDFWAKEDDANGALPKTELEELALSLHYTHPCVATPALCVLTTSLRHVRALRVHVWETRADQLQASRTALEQLLRYAPVLRYLHWRNEGADSRLMGFSDRAFPYAQIVQWTPRALEHVQLTEVASLYRRKPALELSCAAAFLSVVTETSEGNPVLARLTDCDVVSTILAFAASPRVLYVEPNDKDPEGIARRWGRLRRAAHAPA